MGDYRIFDLEGDVIVIRRIGDRKEFMTKTLEREIDRAVRRKRKELSEIREEATSCWIIWIFSKLVRKMRLNRKSVTRKLRTGTPDPTIRSVLAHQQSARSTFASSIP